MILGIGSDLCTVSRISEILEKQGQRFKTRCFADEEQAYADSATDPDVTSARYAKRWAAKEACAKALGMGIREDVFLKDIVVIKDRLGKPVLDLRGGAKEQLQAMAPPGLTAKLHLSLSDDSGLALAFVVITAES